MSSTSTFVENYQRIGNTVVSGSQLLSYLKGPDVRALEFSAQVNNNPIVSAAVGPTGTFLDASHLVQATVSSLLVSPAVVGSTGLLNLGPDTADNAKSYVDFFNLRSTNDTRVLRFVLASPTGNISLGNSSGTNSNVAVQLNGTSSSTQQLYIPGVLVGNPQSGSPGSERIVLVSSSNLNSGSQTVQFNLLASSQ